MPAFRSAGMLQRIPMTARNVTILSADREAETAPVNSPPERCRKPCHQTISCRSRVAHSQGRDVPRRKPSFGSGSVPRFHRTSPPVSRGCHPCRFHRQLGNRTMASPWSRRSTRVAPVARRQRGKDHPRPCPEFRAGGFPDRPLVFERCRMSATVPAPVEWGSARPILCLSKGQKVA